MRFEDFGDGFFWLLVSVMVGLGIAGGVLVFLLAAATFGVVGAIAMAIFIGAAIAWTLFLMLARMMLP